MMLTEQGYYYCSMEKRDLRYYDFATGTDMYLCNKPECKHDGNKFCVATNDKYRIDRICLYGGRLFATAVEETDTEYLFKVLQIALDGSEMNELVTYYTLEKTGATPVEYADDCLFIHRNRMVIPMQVNGQGEDIAYYGTAWVNLDTKEVSYFDEEVLSKDNIAVTDLDGFGEYIWEHESEAVGLRYDGTYFYVADKSYLRGDNNPNGGGEEIIIGNSYLHIFDGNYEKLA